MNKNKTQEMTTKERIEKDSYDYYINCKNLLSPYRLITRCYHEAAIAQRNKTLDEVINLFKTKLLPIDPIPSKIPEIAKAVSEIYESLQSLKIKP